MEPLPVGGGFFVQIKNPALIAQAGFGGVGVRGAPVVIFMLAVFRAAF